MRSIFLAITLASSVLVVPPAAVAAAAADSSAASSDLVELKNTIISLIDQLVAKGVITAEEAEVMKSQAAMKAPEPATQAGAAPGAPAGAQAGSAVVRVPYVPLSVQDEIRAQVREELRQDVTNDVVAVAKAEKWGTAGALPDWVSRLKFSGDFRLRGLGVYQPGTNNDEVPNFQAINEAGGPGAAGADVFLDTTEDVTRGQIRLRLGLDAAITDTVSVRTRLATGNDFNPITRNTSLGRYNNQFDIFLDLAYFDWRPSDPWEGHSFAARGGRVPNPFVSTSLVFDDDLTFDGFTGSYRSDLFGKGQALFVNLGAFALLAESPNSVTGGTNDKYFWGGQVGFDGKVASNVELLAVGSFYDFVNIVGRKNTFGSTGTNWTVPAFIAKGNTVFDIVNDLDPETQLFALAADFQLVNAMVEVAYTGFSPADVVLRLDYVQNIGYDTGEVSSRVGTNVSSRNQGWFAQIEVGDREVRARGQWQVFGGYKYLERDAVLDSFTDSDFHAGGTDAEGWLLGGYLGLGKNLWLRTRWFSADAIDGAPAGFGESFTPLAIDVVQVDLSAKF